MKRPNFALLLALLALTSCSTMHDAAVSTFRVIDAPNVYLRKKLGVDDAQPASTPSAEVASSDPAVYPPRQPYLTQPQQEQAQPQVAGNREPKPPTEDVPGTGPSVAQRERTTTPPRQKPKPAATSGAASTQQPSDLPYGKPVPGKPGYVFSPYDKSGGYVDVSGYAPGQKVKDPYTGKIFLVP